MLRFENELLAVSVAIGLVVAGVVLGRLLLTDDSAQPDEIRQPEDLVDSISRREGGCPDRWQIYCTGGSRPILLDARAVGCQR